MKKITEITTEREFISKLRTYYRKGRRKGYQRNEISFLGVMEYIGHATREFEYQSDKYFSVGIRAYDWVHGNSLLSALIDKWENEIEAEKRKKQHTQPAETPRISTEAAETVNVSAEGEKGAEKAIYAFISKAETILDKIKQKCLNREIYVEDASRYEFMVCMAVSNFVNKHKNCPTEPPQSPETPQTVECATDAPKPRETTRKRPNRAIGSAQHHQYSALGANGYSVLNDASVTMTAMNVRRDTLRDTLHSVTYVPRECSTANTPPYW